MTCDVSPVAMFSISLLFQIEVFPGVVVAGAALPSTTFIAQNWTAALPTMWRKPVHCTVCHNSTATLLLPPARTEKSRHSCNASCSRKTAMQNGNKSVCWSNFQASPPEPWRGLGTATGEVRSVPFSSLHKKVKCLEIISNGCNGSIISGCKFPHPDSHVQRLIHTKGVQWVTKIWKYICFQQRSEDTHWHNALFQSPALPSSSPCVSLAPRPSTDLITDWWTCYLLLAVHYSARRPCLLLSRAWKSFFSWWLGQFQLLCCVLRNINSTTIMHLQCGWQKNKQLFDQYVGIQVILTRKQMFSEIGKILN